MDERDQNINNQENLDQSSILWILLSALSVIAIVVAAGIFFFLPSADNGSSRPRLSSMSSENTGRDFDHIEYVRNADGYPEMVETETPEEEYSVGTSSDETPEESDSMAAPAVSAEETESSDEQSNVIEITPKAEKVEESAEIPVTPTVRKQETMKVSVTVYWIQVGSYNDLIKAEEVRNTLLTQDISSEIQTREVDGITYYRVRLGAFKSKGEADRFLVEIKKMKNFEESYVVQSTLVKEVPVN